MKFEKAKQWFKDYRWETVCTAIIVGTAVGAFWLRDKVLVISWKMEKK